MEKNSQNAKTKIIPLGTLRTGWPDIVDRFA